MERGCAGGDALEKSLVFRAFSRYPDALPSWLLWVRVPSPALIASGGMVAIVPISTAMLLHHRFKPCQLKALAVNRFTVAK